MTESRKHTVAKSDSIRITDGAQEIAGKLTKGERAGIMMPEYTWQHHLYSALNGSVRVRLFAKGLIEAVPDKPSFWRLNETGLEVRRILMEQDHADQ